MDTLDVMRRLEAFEKKNKTALNLDAAESNLDTVALFADEINICGIKFPAPSISVIVLLQAIDSPFLNPDRAAKGLDVIEALFILKHRATIGSRILRRVRIRENIARAEHAAAKKPKLFNLYLDALKEPPDAEYDNLLIEFGECLGPLDNSLAIAQIFSYMRTCTGSSLLMLPSSGEEDDGSKKKFDANWMTWILANASQVCNATEREMMHEMPATRIFYYYVQSMRLKGMKTKMPSDRNSDEMTMDFFDRINKGNDNGTE